MTECLGKLGDFRFQISNFRQAIHWTEPNQAIDRPNGIGKNLTLSAGDLTVKRANTDTTLLWKGQTVKLGETTRALSTKSANENGTEYVAVIDGGRMVWENVPGAAQHLK